MIFTKKYAANEVFADDGSTDRTVEVAECAGADVIHARPYGGGRVQSLLAGYKLALFDNRVLWKQYDFRALGSMAKHTSLFGKLVLCT